MKPSSAAGPLEDNDEVEYVCGPETRELVEQSMNPDAFGGEEAVKERLVEHEAQRRKQDPHSPRKARAARTRKISRRFRTCPPTADAPSNSNAERKRPSQPKPKKLNFGKN